MKNNFFEHNSTSREELRKFFLDKYLINLENKRPLEVGEIVTVIHGPYAHTGVKIKEFKENNIVVVLPTPESEDSVEFSQDEVYTFEDYEDALGAALEEYKFTEEELNAKFPDAMKN